MERNDVYATMLNLSDLIKEKKLRKIETEEELNKEWEKYNKIAFKLEEQVWDKREKGIIKEEKEFRIKFAKHNDVVLQEIMKSISVWNYQIKFLEIGIETLENKFKGLRTAFGVFNL